jgi:thioredoxin-like negative regulator of GroEL
MTLADLLNRLRLDLLASHALRRGNAAKAADLFTRLEQGNDLSSVQNAQLATALLRDGKPKLAQERFASLQKRLSDDLSQRYIQKYCRYYLALMRDERSQADYERRLAQALPRDRKLRRRLPMPPVAEKATPGVVATFSMGGN